MPDEPTHQHKSIGFSRIIGDEISCCIKNKTYKDESECVLTQIIKELQVYFNNGNGSGPKK